MSDREEELQEALQLAQDHIQGLQDTLGKFLSEPLVHATVVHADNEISPGQFANGDLVSIINHQDKKLNGRCGQIIQTPDEEGRIQIMMSNLTKHKLQIGINGRQPQCKLLGKNDGTNVIISVEGQLTEVHGLWGHKFNPADTVKVNLGTKQIVESKGRQGAGDVCFVKSIIDDTHIEVDIHGTPRIVLKSPAWKVEANDRVELDRSNTVVTRHLGRESEEKYILKEESNVTWDDIGGCEDAKAAMIETLELPFKHPEIYKFYNKNLPKGVLLYGPPGCGKTMLGKAAANSVAKTFGKESMASGFIYVKGPELLSMYVGMAEANIRELFHRGRKHYKKTGVPAVLFIDEAEAILPMRGTGRSSDIEKTIVPMFLSEMDGLEASNVIVILATNRPQMLDPAAVRAGRVDKLIKVPRPTQIMAAEVFKLHLKNVPLHDSDKEMVTALATAELFSKQFVLYKIMEKGMPTPRHFTLSDCVNGAMIAGVVDQATTIALRRDLKDGKRAGVKADDFRKAVSSVYRQQLDQNHTFDIEDYLDSNNISKCEVGIEKLKADV